MADEKKTKDFECEGAVDTLVSVLGSSQERLDEEKRYAVTLITCLVTDPPNRRVCQVTWYCVLADGRPRYFFVDIVSMLSGHVALFVTVSTVGLCTNLFTCLSSLSA